VSRTFTLILVAAALVVAGAHIAMAHPSRAALTTGVVDIETNLA